MLSDQAFMFRQDIGKEDKPRNIPRRKKQKPLDVMMVLLSIRSKITSQNAWAACRCKLTHSLMHHFEIVPNSKTQQTTTEM